VSISVTVIGSNDLQLEQLLRAGGVQVMSQPVDHLTVLAQPSAPQPDAIVIDVRGRTELPQALSLLTEHHPSTGALIVASKLDPALMLEAMRARVHECVTEPVAQADLQAAIDRLMGQRQRSAAGQVFAFLGAKGGVGTTTVAVNVAAALAQVAPAATLLIDLHLACGDAALYLGAAPRFSVVDALENIHRLDETFLRGLVVRTSAKLDLLASSNQIMGGPADGERIRALVECASRHYRYIVLDAPRSDAAILEALGVAAAITIVVSQDLAAVRSAGRIATMLRQRYGKDRVKVVLSRYDKLGDIGLEDVARVTGMPVTYQFPSSYRDVLEAVNNGRPLAVDNHNKLATALIAFAHALAGVTGSKPETGASGGLFGRLAGRKTH
jgi:pilus assembly protein CpaE